VYHQLHIQPNRTSAYHPQTDVAQQELKERLAEGIVEPLTSEWAVPMALVRKRDKLSSVSQVDAYPMPRMDDLYDNLVQAQFTTLDHVSVIGTYQYPLVCIPEGIGKFL